MLNKSLPEPLNTEPLANLKSPKNKEPLSTDVTTNPSCGDTDAVTEPDTINDERSASSVRAERGMLNKSLPEPLNTEPDERNILPLKVEPLVTDSTTNPLSIETDAVTLPVAIFTDSSASGASAERGILNKPCPLPE